MTQVYVVFLRIYPKTAALASDLYDSFNSITADEDERTVLSAPTTSVGVRVHSQVNATGGGGFGTYLEVLP